MTAGKTLTAEEAKPAPDPLVRKRKQGNSNDAQDKKKKEMENKSQEERLKDATTPYWNIPYEEQVTTIQYIHSEPHKLSCIDLYVVVILTK